MTIDVVCFGECLLRLAAPGHERLLQTPALQVHFGGAEANVAAALAAFGHNAAVVTVLPQNALGDAALAALRALAVDTRHVVRLPGRMGIYFHTQGAMQRPSEVLYDREHSSFALAEAAQFDWRRILAGARWLHVSGITAAVSGRAASAALNAVKTARQMQILVSFDCNFRSRVWGARVAEAPKLLKEFASNSDLLFADERDLDFMEARAPFESFSQLRWLVRSQRGSHSVDHQTYAGEIVTRSGSHRSRSHDLRGIVERIGAGDAFAAGILHRLLEAPSDLQACVEFAAAAGSYKHSLPGDACIATVAEIEAYAQADSADIKR